MVAQGSSEVVVGVWAVVEAMGIVAEAQAMAEELWLEYGEEAMGMLEAWVLEQGGAEVLEEAQRGAEEAVAHWVAEGSEDMVAEATARRDRLAEGTATSVDILGALDWVR